MVIIKKSWKIHNLSQESCLFVAHPWCMLVNSAQVEFNTCFPLFFFLKSSRYPKARNLK